ncbi:MAG: T9SS type A sorting domain-containing protein [Bacteroidales bacterium]|jgi:hypothetical protein
MLKKSLLNIILILLCLSSAKSQEVFVGLQSNPLLKKAHHRSPKSLIADTLKLPFFDDFSGYRIFPDSTKWSDDNVFINDTYTDDQITAGVATFDALDDQGRLYDTLSSVTFPADHLTSLPIDLTYQPSDSILLSFYYQPGGLADIPDVNDSLTLQFYAPSEDQWYSVWRVLGGSYQKFRLATVRIDQPRFLQKGFRFRFINYVSLNVDYSDPSIVGNCDIWNLDYVLLDKNRTSADTVFHDVAFRKPFRSLLNTYEAMPMRQFSQIYLQEMGSSIPLYLRNNDTITRNVTRDFEIRNIYQNSLVDSSSAGAENISPLTNDVSNADIIYTFSMNNLDSALFKIKAWIITDVFDPKQNDTVVYYQVFNNYFAYDDGSAEEGYGITGLGSINARVAYRFQSYTADTLRAVKICFNDSYNESNKVAFNLVVWDDDNGQPGDVLYTKEGVMVEQGTSINGFYTYALSSPVPVNGVFYVGWKQLSETFLNVGYDINTPPKDRQFYWINGAWNLTQGTGSIMIRPVVGPPLITAVNEVPYTKPNKLHFWPNPAKDHITIDPESIPLSGVTYISIFDMQGRELLNVPCTGSVDLSSLHEGIYIMKMTNNGIPAGCSRLVRIN